VRAALYAGVVHAEARSRGGRGRVRGGRLRHAPGVLRLPRPAGDLVQHNAPALLAHLARPLGRLLARLQVAQSRRLAVG